MLNYKDKNFIKLAALLLIQVFLVTSAACPESISNKNTSSIYIKGNTLRVPIDSTNGYKRMQDVLGAGVQVSFLKENKGWQSRPEYAKYLLDVRNKILELRGAAIDVKVYYYAIGGGFSGPVSGVEDIDIVSPLIATEFTQLIGSDVTKGDFEIFKRRIKKDLSSLQVIDLERISFGRGVENIGGIGYPVFTANFSYLGKIRKVRVCYQLDAAQIYPDELKSGYNILYSRGNPGLIGKMSKAVKSGLINSLFKNNSFIVMENLPNSDLNFDGFNKVSLGDVSWAGVRKLDFYTNISRSVIKKRTMPRRVFISKTGKAAIAAIFTLAAGKLTYESGESSDAEKQEVVNLGKPMHGERYVLKEQFEKEKKDFTAARTSKKNILSSEDAARVEGFLNPERVKAMQFAADEWQLEPAFIAGFLYEENVHTNSLNTIKESIKEFLSRIAGFYDMKNTVGLGNVSAYFMQNKEFLDFLYDNSDFIMNQLLNTEADKAAFKEFIDGTDDTLGYEVIKDIPEDDGGWKDWLKTIYPTLNNLANNAEPINILLAAYAMRVKAEEIAWRNKDETDIPDISIMDKNSSSWVVGQYKEIPDALRARYSEAFNSSYYPPYAYQYFLAADYTGVRSLTERAVAKVKAYIMFSNSGVFTASGAAHFSLRSKDNSLTSKAGLNTTERFKIGRKEYDVNDAGIMNKIEINTDKLGTIKSESGLNITFTIRGPAAKAGLAGYLRDNTSILQKAISRSESLYNGSLNQEITIVLADKYDYLGGDHRKNNLIILNASDLGEMLDKAETGEIPSIFFEELLTSILSEELAHERGAEGDMDTEQKLALEAGFNTKKVLKSQPNTRPLSDYIKFIERFGINVESEPGYLNYLKALNRYEDLDWTKKHARLVADRTVVVGHMEMGLSKALLENLYKKLVNEKGYSEQDAELEVGNLAKLTMTGGLGNIKRELTESWAEKGADLISINILYGRRIQSLDYIKEDAVNNIIEMMGSPEMEFEVEIFDRNDVWQKIKTKVLIYRDPFSPFPNYWAYCPDVFDGSYPSSREHLAQQMLLYRKAGLTLLEKLKEKGRVKDKFLFSLSEVYTAFLIPNAIKDEFKDNPVFKDIFIHHYNHTVVPEGMPKLPVTLWEFIGLNSERYGYSIIEGDKIVPAKIIGQEVDEITGCSVLHTDILKTKVMADFKDKIPDDISEKNSEGAYFDNWQGGQIQKIIAKYYVKLGAENDEDLFNKLENAPDVKEAFIDDQMEAHKKQKDESIAWFNKHGMDLNSDSALVSVTRRLVRYKRVDMLITMLKDESYRKRFMKLGIAIIVGGREFENYSKEQIGALEQLAKDHPGLGKCIFILSEHSDHAGYNIFMAPRIYTAVDATLMLSNKGQEAGPTSSSKGLSNGSAIIAVKDGVIPELLEQFNNTTLEGNGFEVRYNKDGTPSLESLFKVFEDFSKAYKDEKSRRALAYNSLKTGMLKSNISTRQGPELINIWQEGLVRKYKESMSSDKRLASNMKFLFDSTHDRPELVKDKLKNFIEDIDVFLVEIQQEFAPIFNKVSAGDVTPMAALESMKQQLAERRNFVFEGLIMLLLDSVYKSGVIVVPEKGLDNETSKEVWEYGFSLLYRACNYFAEGDLDNAIKDYAKHLLIKKQNYDSRNKSLKDSALELTARYPDKIIGVYLGAMHTTVFIDLKKESQGRISREFSKLPIFYNASDVLIRAMQLGREDLSEYSLDEKKTYLARGILTAILESNLADQTGETGFNDGLDAMLSRIVSRLDLKELRSISLYVGLGHTNDPSRLIRNYVNYLWVNGKIEREELNYLRKAGYDREDGLKIASNNNMTGISDEFQHAAKEVQDVIRNKKLFELVDKTNTIKGGRKETISRMLDFFDHVAGLVKKSAGHEFDAVIYPGSGFGLSEAIPYSNLIVTIDMNDISSGIDDISSFSITHKIIDNFLVKVIRGMIPAKNSQGFIDYAIELVALGADLDSLKVTEDKDMGILRITTLEFTIKGEKFTHTHFRYKIKKEFYPGDEADNLIQDYMAKLINNNPRVVLLSKAGAIDSGVTPYDLTKCLYGKINNQGSEFHGSYILPVSTIIVSDNPNEIKYIEESERGKPRNLKPFVVEEIKNVEIEMTRGSELSYGYASYLEKFLNILELTSKDSVEDFTKKEGFYKNLAQHINENLEGMGILCKKTSAIIVEKLFKEYEIKAVVMGRDIGNGAHYWVETQDGFIIDAFTLGYGSDLTKRAETLGDKDVIVVHKDTKDPLERKTIEEFYKAGIYQYQLTESLWNGELSAIAEAETIYPQLKEKLKMPGEEIKSLNLNKLRNTTNRSAL